MAQDVLYDWKHPIDVERAQAVLKLLEQSFPPSERRTSQGQLDLLRNPHYRLLVRPGESGSAVTAFFAWWDLKTCRFGEHFAVDDTLRGKGFGGVMLDQLVACEKRMFILEVEPPKTGLADRRIHFYERHGFHLNPYPYLQPPLREGIAPLPLMIMSHPRSLTPEEFALAQDEIYRTIYGLTDGKIDK